MLIGRDQAFKDVQGRRLSVGILKTVARNICDRKADKTLCERHNGDLRTKGGGERAAELSKTHFI